MVIPRTYINCFENAFETVFKADIREITFNRGIASSETDDIVSAIEFSGDYSGDMLMVINREQRKEITGYICRLFNIDFALSEDLIYSEILNIFSGNVLTGFLKLNRIINITPPKNTDDLSYRGARFDAVGIETVTGLKFKFYLLYKD